MTEQMHHTHRPAKPSGTPSSNHLRDNANSSTEFNDLTTELPAPDISAPDLLNIRSMSPQTIYRLQGTLGNHALRQHLSRSIKVTPAEPQIQRKLAGNLAILLAIDSKKKINSKWRDIVILLGDYEKLEEKTGGQFVDQKQQIEMLGLLGKMIVNIEAWLRENEAPLAAPRQEREKELAAREGQQGMGMDAPPAPAAKSDKKSLKMKRDVDKFTALRILRGRVYQEKRIVQQLSVTGGQADYTLNRPQEKGAAAHGGQVSDVSQFTFKSQGKSPEEKGYFAGEKSFSAGRDNAGFRTGIPQLDPNMGARAIAMVNIDRLISDKITELAAHGKIGKTNHKPLLVKTDFATRKEPTAPGGVKQGVFMQSALASGEIGGQMRGEYLDKHKASVLGAGNAAAAGSTAPPIRLDDPMLMRSLNKLQLLDALCGQVDRHTGNYFVLTDPGGQVIGVRGIDNDMAFGNKIQDANDPKTKDDLLKADKAWRGTPIFVDSEMREAVLAIETDTLLSAVEGLLENSEAKALADRLRNMKQYLLTLTPNNVIKPDEWNSRKAELHDAQTFGNSYLGQARAEGIKGLLTADKTNLRGFLGDMLKDVGPFKSEEIKANNMISQVLDVTANIVRDLLIEYAMSAKEDVLDLKILGLDIGVAILKRFKDSNPIEKIAEMSLNPMKREVEALAKVVFDQMIAQKKKSPQASKVSAGQGAAAPPP